MLNLLPLAPYGHHGNHTRVALTPWLRCRPKEMQTEQKASNFLNHAWKRLWWSLINCYVFTVLFVKRPISSTFEKTIRAVKTNKTYEMMGLNFCILRWFDRK